MTTQHTPGPWAFNEDGGWYIKAPGQLGSLMGNDTYYPWNSENKADWLLIAAAPEMLKALRDVETLGLLPPSLLLRVRAAITKATGETV